MKNKNKKILKSKRSIDIVLSSLVLFLSLPLTLTALLLIKLEQMLRGRCSDPLFYKEIRMSYGRQFYLYKFNIFKYELILGDQKNGVFIHTKKYEKNNGVLRVGWLLKQTYMDELPQFFNVLIGDMSIVGPRPVNLEVYKDLISCGVNDKDRAPAGITGYYQSCKNMKDKSATEMDQKYADYYQTEKWYKVIFFDLRIMLRTIKVILQAKGI